MYKAKLDKTFYIVGEIHGERCIDSYSHLIPECDSLLLEADPNNASIYNLLDYDPEPLENRVSKSVIHLIMDYVDFEDVRYKTLESVLHLIFFYYISRSTQRCRSR
jgi:hypothetical protein